VAIKYFCDKCEKEVESDKLLSNIIFEELDVDDVESNYNKHHTNITKYRYRKLFEVCYSCRVIIYSSIEDKAHPHGLGERVIT